MEKGTKAKAPWRSRRPQQERKRRQKRSASFGADTRNQSNGTAPEEPATSQQEPSTFHVEIPQFYKTSTVPGISENGAGQDRGAVEDGGRFEAEPQREAVPRRSEQARVHATGAEREELHLDDHDAFIAALEKHGSSAGAWRSMASELGSTVEEVKVRSYSYFKTLVHNRNVNNCDAPQPTTGVASTTWSLNESILLDSLLMKHCHDLNVHCLDAKPKRGGDGPRFLRQSSVWEKVASHFPGKTAAQCQEKGISTLRRLAHHAM